MNTTTSAAFPRFLALLLCVLTGHVAAQCNNIWLPGAGVPGVAGNVVSLVEWDPDGAGPEPLRVVVGGRFSIAGGIRSEGIAFWDPVADVWESPAGGVFGGLYNGVTEVLPMANGDLVAVGDFTLAGNTQASGIARWDGSAWNGFGPGIELGLFQAVHTALELPNGDVLVGGQFQRLGSQVPAAYVARWDGSSWQPLGGGTDGRVRKLLLLPNGDVMAAGDSSVAGGVAAAGCAIWNGSSWAAVPGGGFDNWVYDLALAPNGDVIAVGLFHSAGGTGASRVASWSGSSWSALGSGADGMVLTASFDASGDLFVGGSFSAVGGVPAAQVARWDGASWSPLVAGIGGSGGQSFVFASLASSSLGMVFGGSFQVAGTRGVANLARWQGSTWHRIGRGFSDTVRGLIELSDGDLIATGQFHCAPGAEAAFLARQHLGVWSSIGGPLDGLAETVIELSNGDLLVGGSFSNAGGVPASRIARWDGSSWTALGGTIDYSVAALLELPGGEVVAAGNFQHINGQSMPSIALWNGTTWLPMGSYPFSGPVAALARMPSGEVVAAGSFVAPLGSGIARWDGSSWSDVGGGLNGYVRDLHVTKHGDLVAVGQFTLAGGVSVGHVARWDGTSWHGYGSGFPARAEAVAEAPNGDLFVGGKFETARWNGAAWIPIGVGEPDMPVLAMAMRQSGELSMAGEFELAGGEVSVSFATLATDCPASAVSFGTACTGPNGAAQLAADTLPWVGSDLLTVGTSLPPQSLVASVYGFAPTAQPVPLAALLPEGVAGCDLLVEADAVELGIAQGSMVAWSLPIPSAVSLAGLPLYQQLVPFAFGAQGQLASVTSSNALGFTIGAF